MARHIEVQDLPPIVANDEKAVEHAERNCGHSEEIHRGDGFAVIPEEGQPTLGRNSRLNVDGEP